MKISVIIPSYKPKVYLFKCIDSLEVQANNAEYEILIILNGCNEPYYSQITQYINRKKYHNIQVILSDIAGVSNARNIGIDKAKGDNVLFIDDDDWVSPYYLDQLAAISTNKEIVHSNIVLIEEETNKELPYFINKAFLRNKKNHKITLFQGRSLLSSSCAKLIPKSVIDNVRFNPKHKLGEDSLFMFSISNNIKEIKLTTNDTIYYVRARAKSASRKHYTYKKRINVALNLLRSYIFLYIKHPFSYNIPLFGSRVIATIIKLRKKEYE